MVRNTLISLTSAAALVAAQGALAQSGSPAASTTTGVDTDRQITYEMTAGASDDAAMDDRMINMPVGSFTALANARGAPMRTSDGTRLGLVESVDADGQGLPRLVVDVSDRTVIDADRLIINVTQDNMAVMDERLTLLTSVEELKIQAKKNVRDSDGRVYVTVS